jgi:hypothetical protein
MNPRNVLVTGLTYFAGVMMLLVGVLDALQGLAAVIHKEYFAVGANFVFAFDVRAWGWIHLVLGVVVAVAGGFVFTGALWARIVGVVVAALVGVSNFMWLPYQPIWSVVLIGLSVLVIWALVVHSTDSGPTAATGSGDPA